MPAMNALTEMLGGSLHDVRVAWAWKKCNLKVFGSVGVGFSRRSSDESSVWLSLLSSLSESEFVSLVSSVIPKRSDKP